MLADRLSVANDNRTPPPPLEQYRSWNSLADVGWHALEGGDIVVVYGGAQA